MKRFFHYSALIAQGCIVALFLGFCLYGQLFVILEIQRKTSQLDEKNKNAPRLQQYITGSFLSIPLIYLNEMAFATLPYFLGVVGIQSAKATLVFPILHFITSMVALHRGIISTSFALMSVHNILIAYTHIINERERERKNNVPPVNKTQKSKIETQESDLTPEEPEKPFTIEELVLLQLLSLFIPKDFSYERLTGKRSIRLLNLEPNNLFDEPLECKLFEVQLDEAPPYTALSYAWDAAEGTTNLVCNGCQLKVTKNCARALQQIREKNSRENKSVVVNLWVDAICIDQGSDPEVQAERLQQIQIMGEIYKKASHVTAWVGEHKNDSQYICDFFRSVGFAFEDETTENQQWDKAESLALMKARQWIKFQDRLRAFFQRSWFMRIWPIQEVTLPLPGRVDLLCGDFSMPFECIRAGWQVLAKIELLPNSVHLDQCVALQFYLADALALKRGKSLNLKTRTFGQPLITDLSQLSLSSIMRATRFKACTFPKDKFFALLGVLEELEIPHTVDISRYTEMTEPEVFSAIFRSCIAFEKNLDVLRLAQSSDGYIGVDDFWAKRQDPYDSVSNAVHGMFANVLPLLFRGVTDNIPRWRLKMPTWIPDWNQWTYGNIDHRDIALISSYSTTALWNRAPWRALRSFNFTLPLYNTFQDNYLPDSNFLRQLVTADRGGSHNVPLQRLRRLRVRAKIVGVVCSVGSVDSVALLWQLVASAFNFYGYQRGWDAALDKAKNHPISFFQPIPDAFLAAMIETFRNLVITSHSSQINLSLRMMRKAYGLPALFKYSNSLIQAWYIHGVLQRVLCYIFPSIDICVGNEIEFGWTFWVSTAILIPTSMIITFVWFPSSINNPPRRLRALYHYSRHFGAGIITSCAYLIWELRVTIYNTLYSDNSTYKEMASWFVQPFSILLAVHGVIPLVAYFEDEISILFVRITSLLCFLPILYFTFFYSILSYLTKAMLISIIFQTCRCWRGALSEVLGSEMFKRQGSFTTGLNFFTTESGLTGSTSGPVQLFDVVVIVDRVSDPMVIRRRDDEFEIVAAAYIGNISKENLERSSVCWKIIDIC